MSTAVWRSIWQRPASISDLRHLAQIAGTSSSRCSSAQEMTEAALWRRSTPPPFSSSRGWWRQPAARKGRILTLLEPVRFYYPGASRVRPFSTANQRPASLSDLGRVPQISGVCSSESPSAQAVTEAAAWRQPTSPAFSSSRGQASAPGFIDRIPPCNLRHLHLFGTSSRSLSESAGCWRRQAAWKRPICVLREPARFFHSGLDIDNGRPRRQRQATKQHLYLVLDDQEDSFSIHKLDIDNVLDVCGCSAEAPWRFSEPPVLRIVPPTIGKSAQFAALGSHIIATCPIMRMSIKEEPSLGGTLTFDTKTAALSVSKIVPGCLPSRYDAAIAVSNSLYVFESVTDNNFGLDDGYFRGGLHCLTASPNVDDDDMYWTWRPLFSSSQFFWSWTDNPPSFPFDSSTIIAHVVHPRTGTIFVSALGHVGWGTFSYGTRGSGQWKNRGDWVLPFKGPAHYDHELGAWIGLHRESVHTNDANGYLCACRVMSGWQPPKWEVGKEKLFLEDPQWRHVDAKLIYMGECSKYCLVERLLPEEGDKSKYVLRLTTFIVNYGEDGGLSTMTCWPARFYKAPSYRCHFDVQAFWM